MCGGVKTCVIVVGGLECVIYESLEQKLVDNRNWGKPSQRGQHSPTTRKGRQSFPRTRQRWTLREVLHKIAAQACMDVIK
jgi:hypothetical protein